jgi:hypothetical protein
MSSGTVAPSTESTIASVAASALASSDQPVAHTGATRASRGPHMSIVGASPSHRTAHVV